MAERRTDKLQVFSFVIFLSLVASIIYAIAMVADYFIVYEKFIDAKKATCITVRSQYGSTQNCTCGKHCYGYYKCIQIFVSLYENLTITMTVPVNATEGVSQLFENERVHSKNKCSYIPKCLPKGGSYWEVKQFADTFGSTGANYSCFYQLDDPTSIVRVLTGNGVRFYHMFFWPSLLFFIFLVILVGVKIKRKNDGMLVILGIEEMVACIRGSRNEADNNSSDDIQIASISHENNKQKTLSGYSYENLSYNPRYSSSGNQQNVPENSGYDHNDNMNNTVV